MSHSKEHRRRRLSLRPLDWLSYTLYTTLIVAAYFENGKKKKKQHLTTE